jgi:hypothetical protein
MNLRGAKPVTDNKIKDFIQNLNPVSDLYNENIQSEFLDNFFEWIKSSKLNNLIGLDDFTNKKLCAGTAQAFDHFYWRNKDRTFRTFPGEFMYHGAVLKHGGKHQSIIKNDLILPNQAVIVSVPFSDYGKQHDDLERILELCYKNGNPVLLDFAYYPCTKNINLDLSKYPCVKTVTFSISKAFYGAEFLRVGMRLEREDKDDGIDVFNSVEMVNRVSLSIANSLIKAYDVDYNWHNYASAYIEACNEYNLEYTDCIMFGLGGAEYVDYNRGTSVNRICISEIIGSKINV